MENMQKQVEYITLNELMTGDYMGLAVTEEQIQSVLNSAVRSHSNEFYVGTDVKQWLSSFEALNQNDLEEKFSQYDDDDNEIPHTWKDHQFEILLQDNSYNWGRRSNTDIDFRLLQSENGDCYAYVRVHIGTDIRSGYTDGILLDLETDSKDCFINFVDNLYEYGNSGYIEIDGIEYGIQGEILSEYLSIYNYTTHEIYETCGAIYEFDEQGFENALREIVLEALEENKKD